MSAVGLRTEDRLEQTIRKFNESREESSEVTLKGRKLPNPHLGVKMTLGDLRATVGNPLQGRLIESLQLNKSIEELNKSFPFFERLQKVSYKVLDQVPLLSLQLLQNQIPQVSEVADALMEEEVFITRPVQEVANRLHLKVFIRRMESIYQERPDLVAKLAETPFRIPNDEESLELSAARIPLLSSEEILAIKDKMPIAAFGLLTDVQLHSLDLSKLTSEQIATSIRGGTIDQITAQRRFALLSTQQLSLVFQVVEDRALLHDFPVGSLRKLPLAEMPAHQIHELFCAFNFSEEEQRMRVAMLPPDTMNAILSKLDRGLRHLSDDQIRGLDCSKVTRDELHEMFSCFTFSDQEKSRRISLIPPEAIGLVIKIGDSDFLKRLTEGQLLALDLRQLENKEIENIFLSSSFSDEEKRARVALLPAQVVDQLIQRGLIEVLKYLSDEQLLKINITNIAQEHLEFLFPTLDPSKWYPDHTYSVSTYFHGKKAHSWEKKDSSGVSLNSMSDEVVRMQIEQHKAQCLKNFRILIRKPEFEAIRGKIRPDVLAFLESSDN